MLPLRRNNQLDSFIAQQAQQAQQAHAHHQGSNNPSNAQRMLSPRNVHPNDRNVSPNRISNTRKPMISPVRTAPAPQQINLRPRPSAAREQCCANESHRGKRAEYMIRIEEEDMFYCGVCATQAASQGFTVTRITAPKRQRAVPQLPNYAGNPRYQELTALMRDILHLESQFKRRSPRNLEEHYRRQEDMLVDFYDAVAATINTLRDQHLDQLRTEQMKCVAAGEMQFSHLELHMEDLNEAWEDIEETFHDVLEKIDPQSFEEGMRAYHNTLNVFRHKLEEFDDGTLPLTNLDSSVLSSKLKGAEATLHSLWREQDHTSRRAQEKTRANTPQTSGNRPANLKSVHEGLPKSKNQPEEGQTAFRNLFPDDQSEERLPEASPQFKAF